MWYIWALIIGSLLAGIIWLLLIGRNGTQQKVATEARIVAIDDKYSGVSFTHTRQTRLNLDPQWCITFELLSNGEQKKCYVSVMGNKKPAVGDTGLLTTQGTRYISFR